MDSSPPIRQLSNASPLQHPLPSAPPSSTHPVFSFRAGMQLLQRGSGAAHSTPSHSSETSESTDNGDAMVTDDSGCDTSQHGAELMMEEVVSRTAKKT